MVCQVSRGYRRACRHLLEAKKLAQRRRAGGCRLWPPLYICSWRLEPWSTCMFGINALPAPLLTSWIRLSLMSTFSKQALGSEGTWRQQRSPQGVCKHRLILKRAIHALKLANSVPVLPHGRLPAVVTEGRRTNRMDSRAVGECQRTDGEGQR